jgi:hypothetical protein
MLLDFLVEHWALPVPTRISSAPSKSTTSHRAALAGRGLDPNALDPRGQHGLFLALREVVRARWRTLLAAPGDIRVDASNARPAKRR